MDTFKKRLEWLLSKSGLNPSQFAMKLGYNNSEKISRLLRNEKNKPGFDILNDIANNFEINLNWLVTGKGDSPVYKNTDYEKIRIENLKLKEMLKVCDEEKNKYQKRIDELQQDLIQFLKKNRKD